MTINKTIRRLSGRKTAGTLVVLTYHSIQPEQRSKFEKQMDRLMNMGKPVFADIGNHLPIGVNHIAVTFDDGFSSVLQNALPAMHKRQLPVTLFLPVGNLGRQPVWIKDPNHENAKEVVISAEQLKGLSDNQVRIGSHCITHPKLTTLEAAQVKTELFESKTRLETLLDKEINMLSFPFNDYNKNIVEIARLAGYSRVFANVPTYPIDNIDRFLLGRINVSPEDWNLEYWLKSKGAYQWLPLAIVVKKRLRFITRLVFNRP